MAGTGSNLNRQPKSRIFLVEDHPITRDGLAQLINLEDDIEVCGHADNNQSAMTGVDAANPNLAIIDISLSGGSGIELIKALLARNSALRILVLSTHDEMLYAERALRAGAHGYIMKSEPTELISKAIRHVLRGRTFLSERMRERLLGNLVAGTPRLSSDVLTLSDRELEVFELIGKGKSTSEIASALNVSPSTVATHRTHIMEKLRFDTMAGLVRRAVEWLQSQGL